MLNEIQAAQILRAASRSLARRLTEIEAAETLFAANRQESTRPCTAALVNRSGVSRDSAARTGGTPPSATPATSG